MYDVAWTYDPSYSPMDRYYSTLKTLPTALLQSSSPLNLDEIKQSRWATRDSFLQISQEPFAGANGIGPDHLQNFLDLQDAIIAKMIIKRLEELETDTQYKQQQLCGILQLIFTESPKLIEFLFAAPTTTTPIPILRVLVQNCPALFALTPLLKDFRNHSDYQKRGSREYYWSLIVFLAMKYPIQVTLDLCQEVLEERSRALLENNTSVDKERCIDLIEDIGKVFPFLLKKNTNKPN